MLTPDEKEIITMLTYIQNTGSVEEVRRTYEYFKKYEEGYRNVLENIHE